MRIYKKCIRHLSPLDNTRVCLEFFDSKKGHEGKRYISGRNQGDQMNICYLYNYNFYSKTPPPKKHNSQLLCCEFFLSPQKERILSFDVMLYLYKIHTHTHTHTYFFYTGYAVQLAELNLGHNNESIES